MKKIIPLSVSILVVFSILVFAFEFNPIVNEEQEEYVVTLPVSKGWNLLPSTSSFWDIRELSDQMEDNLKYSFLYLPIQNQYINSFGGFNNENGKLNGKCIPFPLSHII